MNEQTELIEMANNWTKVIILRLGKVIKYMKRKLDSSESKNVPIQIMTLVAKSQEEFKKELKMWKSKEVEISKVGFQFTPESIREFNICNGNVNDMLWRVETNLCLHATLVTFDLSLNDFMKKIEAQDVVFDGVNIPIDNGGSLDVHGQLLASLDANKLPKC